MKEESKNQLQAPLVRKDEVVPDAQGKKDVNISFISLFRYSNKSEKIKMIVGTVAAMIAGAAFPFFMIFFGDITKIFTIREGAGEKGFQLFLKFAIIGGASWFMSFLGIYCWSSAGASQSTRFKKLYYTTLIDQEVAWYDSNDVNKLATKVAANIVAIQNAIGQKVALLLSTIVTSIFGFFYAYFKCWELSLVLTGTLPLLMIAGILLMKAMTLNAQKGKNSYENASGRAEESFGAIKTIKSLVGEVFEFAKFRSALDVGKKTVVKHSLFVSCSLSAVTFIFLGVYSLGFWYGKTLLINKPFDYEAGTIIGTFFCFVIGGSSVGQISPILKNIAEGKVAAAELFDLIEREKTLIEPKDGIKIKHIKDIQLQDVTFSYKKEEHEAKTLSQLNLHFQKNKLSALVGQSGCGKSTIVQLLLRYYDTDQGSITINGKNIKEIDINSFRKKIGFVGQEPVLFAMSIQDNLKLANPKITDDQMIEALKKANAWEFIQKMEKGLKSYVGTGGAQLSGGQKQRIAIARAIIKNPQILILDEATSALDRKNQKQIQKTLKNLQQTNITTIVIAHRLSTIKNADEIFVLKKGELKEQGTHGELIIKAGFYTELVQTQIAAEKGKEHENEEIEKIDPKELQRKLSQQEIEEEKQVQKVVEIVKQQEKKVIQIPKQKQDVVFKKLLAYSKPNCLFIIVGTLSAIINGLTWPFFNVAFSNVIGLMSDAANKSDEIDQYCLLFLLVAIIGGSATFSYTFNFAVVGERLVYDLRVKLFQKLLKAPVSYYDKKQNTPGAISTKLATDAYQINNMVTGVIAVICLNLSTVTASLFFAFSNSWKLTLIILALSPLLMVAGAINMSVIKKMTSKSEEFQKFIGSLISDTVCNIRTVKSFGNPINFIKKFQEKLAEIDKIAAEKCLKASFWQGMSRGMIMIVEGLAFWIAALLYEDNQVSDLQSILIALFSIVFAAMGVGQNSAFMPDMAKAKLAGAGIFEIIESKDEEQLALENGGLKKQILEGTIQFNNITFKYPERETIVLENFTLKINKNQKVALVGPSGSGKSTIIQLLLRFYQPETGQILINGQNINEFDLYHYRNQLGLVAQQPGLFVGTVKQNIQYNRDIEDSQIEKMVQISHAHKFINEWQEKYEKQVGQKGSQVSGGQKQRIALTRCLVRHPAIYLLDESTSALDADTEKLVFESLKPILKERTSVSIAHRLSTIEDANRIIVMRDGKIIEEGQYNQLMQLRGNFYKLAQGQE